jgi:hypothetical protein
MENLKYLLLFYFFRFISMKGNELFSGLAVFESTALLVLSAAATGTGGISAHFSPDEVGL